MSLKNIDRPEKNVAVLEVEIDKKVFDEAVTRIYRKKSPNLSVPGFRKGKAPRSVVEKMYGSGIFYEDALNELMPEAIDNAVKESEIEIVSRPEVDLKEIGADGVILTAKVYTKPDVEISNYKKLEATRTKIIVSDENVDSEIEKIRARNARDTEISDRPAQMGDNTNIDFEGFIDDVAFEGGKGENHKLKLGSGSFIPGFEEQIVGKNTGDEFDVSLNFPEEYPNAPDLAGKPAVFKVKLNEIRFEELPELDNEFVQDVSEFDTLEEYKADIKAKIEERYSKRAEFVVEEQIVDCLVANLSGDIPEVMFEEETDNQMREQQSRMQQQGMDLNFYLQYTGQTVESFRAQLRLSAERQVKVRLALEKIVELEKIEVSDEDLAEEYKKIAEAYKIDEEAAKAAVDANVLKKDIGVRKAVDFIKAEAEIKEVEQSAEEFAKAQNAHNHEGHSHTHTHEHDEDCDCEDEDYDDDEDYDLDLDMEEDEE